MIFFFFYFSTTTPSPPPRVPQERRSRREKLAQEKLLWLKAEARSKIQSPQHPVGRLLIAYVRLFQQLYGKALHPFSLPEPRRKGSRAELRLPTSSVWFRDYKENARQGRIAYAGPIPDRYPYPRYLRRVLSLAKIDLDGFCNKVRTLLCSETVLGVPKDDEILSPGLTNSFCAEMISRSLFAEIHPVVMDLYRARWAPDDHLLMSAVEEVEKADLKWSDTGLDPSLCLEERLAGLIEAGVTEGPKEGEEEDDLYSHAVEMFRSLQVQRDPTSKLNTIVASAQELCRSVDLFVQRYESPEQSSNSQPAVM